MDDAACKGRPGEPGPEEDTPDWLKQDEADLYCFGCQVKAECAVDALQSKVGGTFRAGIYVPGAKNSYRDRTVRRKLRMIAESGGINVSSVCV